MKTKIVYYVHGTMYDNASKKCSGWRQVELNELGKEQAINLGKTTPYKFDILYTSDLIRAEETARLAFPNGESLKAVEKRIQSFVDDILKKHKGKTIGIIAHRSPQLALEVITKKISWEEANKNDWRKTGDWKPGWEYYIN